MPTATSVRLAGSGASATEITAASLAALENLFGRWEAGDDLTADYRAKSVTLGKDVSAAVGDTVWRGGRSTSTRRGALKLATASGPRTVWRGIDAPPLGKWVFGTRSIVGAIHAAWAHARRLGAETPDRQ